MMKVTKHSGPAAKPTTGASNLVYPDSSLKCNPTSGGSQLMGKKRLQSVTTTIIQEGGTKANSWNSGGFNNPADSSVSNRTVASGLCVQMSNRGTNNPGEIYSVSEEAGESETEEHNDGGEDGNPNCKATENPNTGTDVERDEMRNALKEDDEVLRKRCICDKSNEINSEFEGCRL